jgi:hypothetical protein
MQGP